MQARLHLATRNYQECKAVCVDLCGASLPITDYDQLTHLYELVTDLRKIDRSYNVPQIAAVWRHAIKIAKSRELQTGFAAEWATQSIKHEQWSSLGQVCGQHSLTIGHVLWLTAHFRQGRVRIASTIPGQC